MIKWNKLAAGVMLSLSLCLSCTGCANSSEAQEETEIGTAMDAPAAEGEDGTGAQGSGTKEQAGAQKPGAEPGHDTERETNAETGESDSAQVTDALVRIWGPVLRVEGDRLIVDNRSEMGSRGELVLTIDPEKTLILDAESGFLVALSELAEENEEDDDQDAVFAYLEPIMGLSEPPVAPARLIFCDIPDDLRVPEYVEAETVETQQDGNVLLTAKGGMQYRIPAACEMLPYLTRNIVKLEDLQEGSTCLIWSDERLTAKKVVLFADGQ